MTSITTIINMCSGDRNFIPENVKAISDISDNVIIPYCTHLHNGQPDNMEKIQIAKNACKDLKVKFVEFSKKNNSLVQNHARWEGFKHVNTDFVLFLDADEIFEKNKINDWVKNFDYTKYEAITFRCHFYAIKTCYRAITNLEYGKHYVGSMNPELGRFYDADTEMAGLLIKSDLINEDRIYNGPERWRFLQDPDIANKLLKVKALDNSFMLHHYAYVRSKEEMKRKTANFAHKNEKPWGKIIDHYFSNNFDITENLDPCHGYIMEKIQPVHNILSLKQFDQQNS